MHLVYKALEKYAIPSVLPPELMPPGKRKDIAIPVTKPPAPVVMTAAPPPIPPLPNASTVKSMTGLDSPKVLHICGRYIKHHLSVISVN